MKNQIRVLINLVFILLFCPNLFAQEYHNLFGERGLSYYAYDIQEITPLNPVSGQSYDYITCGSILRDGELNAMIMKVSNGGDRLWVTELDQQGNDEFNQILAVRYFTDPQYTNEVLEFWAVGYEQTSLSSSTKSVILSRFDASGSHISTVVIANATNTTFGGTNSEVGLRLKLLNTGLNLTDIEIYILGQGGDDQISSGSEDILVYRLNSSGSIIWSKFIDNQNPNSTQTSGNDKAGDFEFDDYGNVVVVGTSHSGTSSNLDFCLVGLNKSNGNISFQSRYNYTPIVNSGGTSVTRVIKRNSRFLIIGNEGEDGHIIEVDSIGGFIQHSEIRMGTLTGIPVIDKLIVFYDQSNNRALVAHEIDELTSGLEGETSGSVVWNRRLGQSSGGVHFDGDYVVNNGFFGYDDHVITIGNSEDAGPSDEDWICIFKTHKVPAQQPSSPCCAGESFGLSEVALNPISSEQGFSAISLTNSSNSPTVLSNFPSPNFSSSCGSFDGSCIELLEPSICPGESFSLDLSCGDSEWLLDKITVELLKINSDGSTTSVGVSGEYDYEDVVTIDFFKNIVEANTDYKIKITFILPHDIGLCMFTFPAEHLTLTVNPVPGPFPSDEILLPCGEDCIDIGIEFVPGSEGFPFTVEWENGSTDFIRTVCPTEPTCYSATYTNSFGCSAEQLYLVSADTCCLEADFEIEDTFCYGEPIIADGSISDPHVRHVWEIYDTDNGWENRILLGQLWGIETTDGNGNIIPNQAGIIDLSTIFTVQPGKCYTVLLGIQKYCEGVLVSGTYAIKGICIVEAPGPFPSLEYLIPCDSTCVTVEVHPGNNQIEWQDGSTDPVRRLCPDPEAIYTVTYTNEYGCSTEQLINVTRDTCCLDSCFNLPDTLCEGDPLIVDVSCLEGKIFSYRWIIQEEQTPGVWVTIYSPTEYQIPPIVPLDLDNLGVELDPDKTYRFSLELVRICDGVTITRTFTKDITILSQRTVTVTHTTTPGYVLDFNNLNPEWASCYPSTEILSITDITNYISLPLGSTVTVNQTTQFEIEYECCTLILTIIILEQGVGSPIEDIYLDVQPNPTQNEFEVYVQSVESKVIDLSAPVYIYNSQGSLVYIGEIENGYASIDLLDYSAGLYIIRIPLNGSFVERKVIKTK